MPRGVTIPPNFQPATYGAQQSCAALLKLSPANLIEYTDDGQPPCIASFPRETHGVFFLSNIAALDEFRGQRRTQNNSLRYFRLPRFSNSLRRSESAVYDVQKRLSMWRCLECWGWGGQRRPPVQGF